MNLNLIYFVYGLVFFSIGIVIWTRIRQLMDNRLARTFGWLVAFGLIHAIHEWIEMFVIMGHTGSEVLFIATFVTALSFAALLQFGVEVIGIKKNLTMMMHLVPAILFSLWFLFYLKALSYEEGAKLLEKRMLAAQVREMTSALGESEEKYRTLFELAGDALLTVVPPREGILDANEAAVQMLGYSRQELRKLCGQDIIAPEVVEETDQEWEAQVKDKGHLLLETIWVRKDGSHIAVEVSGKPFELRDKVLFQLIGRDITERKRAEEALRESEEKYRTILESIEDGYYEVDVAGNFTFFNDSLCRILGHPKDELMGMNNRQYMDDENAKKVYRTFNAVYRTGKPAKAFDWEVIRKDGTRRFVEASVSLIRGSTGEPAGFRGIVRDITERKRAEEQLAYMATHDALTGLPNRMLFNDRFILAVAHADRNQQKLAVMLLDLDYFKDVNDTLGHSVGDLLLQVVGDRLTSLLRKGDTVARMGGDEFMLLLPETAQEEDAANIAQKILEAFRKPFVFDDHELRITTSIGIALYPDAGEDGDTLMKNADIAMYRAKDQGRDNHQRYTPATKVEALE